MIFNKLWTNTRLINYLIMSNIRYSHHTAFISFYERNTGQKLDEYQIETLNRKHPKLQRLQQDQLLEVWEMLDKFGMKKLDVLYHPHIFTIKPSLIENYHEVLTECGILEMKVMSLIRYHTLVRARTIKQLKKSGHLEQDANIVRNLHKCFDGWPDTHPLEESYEENDNLLKIRTRVMQRYVEWRIGMSRDEFEQFNNTYNYARHKPMSCIQESIHLAENVIQLSKDSIKKNAYVIAMDANNTKTILEKVDQIAGLDTKQVLRMTPSILKNNYKSVLRIRDLLEEFGFSFEAQRRSLMVYCLSSDTVEQRIRELQELPEFAGLKDHPRALLMVLYKEKMSARLDKFREDNKPTSLDNLVSSNQVYNAYKNTEKPRGRDIASVISKAFHNVLSTSPENSNGNYTNLYEKKSKQKSAMKDLVPPIVTADVRFVTEQLKCHPYWRYAKITNVVRNIETLKDMYSDKDVFRNCLLLLYPLDKLNSHSNITGTNLTKEEMTSDKHHFLVEYSSRLNMAAISDDQILRLILYFIEKECNFTGNGIWENDDEIPNGVNMEPKLSRRPILLQKI